MAMIASRSGWRVTCVRLGFDHDQRLVERFARLARARYATMRGLILNRDNILHLVGGGFDKDQRLGCLVGLARTFAAAGAPALRRGIRNLVDWAGRRGRRP